MVDIYLPCLFVAQLNYPLIFTNTLVKNWFDIYHTETQKNGSFLSIQQKSGWKLILSLCLLGSE